MTQLPKDPLTPASKGQILFVGLASLIAGIAFLAFAAWTIALTYSLGRLGRMPVMIIIGLMAMLGIGFLDFAFAAFRSKGKRRNHLLSSTTLYLAGGFLFALPIGILIVGLLNGSASDLSTALGVFSLSSIGLLAIRLARIRRNKGFSQPTQMAGKE